MRRLMPDPRPILFLDVATVTGWACGVPGGEPESGSVRLGRSGATDAEVFGAMIDFLAPRAEGGKLRLIVYEAPVGPGMDRAGLTNFKTKARLLGLRGVVEGVCHQTRTECAQESAQRIRKSVLGARPPKGEAKAAVLAAVRARGFEPSGHDEADALAGWIHACSLIDSADRAAAEALL